MNYEKLDAALAVAVESAGDPDARDLPVFIRLAGPPPVEDAVRLGELGIDRAGLPAGSGHVVTATLSARDVAELSEQPWVIDLRSAHRLKTL